MFCKLKENIDNLAQAKINNKFSVMFNSSIMDNLVTSLMTVTKAIVP